MIQGFKANIKGLFKDVYFLLVVLLGISLIIFKIPFLEVSFIGDELWVYGPAALEMSNRLPSLLPSSLDLSHHFAHPMFFLFSAGLWGNVFGASVVSMHAFGLFVSVSLLLVLYLVLKRFLGQLVAFLSVLVFLVQSIFLAQASLTLPEVLLTLLTFTTIYFYHRKLKLPYVVSGILLVLTKETGVLLIGALVIWSLIKDVIYDKNNLFSKSCIKNYLIVIAPLLALALHVLFLKLNYGWYIMPDRMDHFEVSIDSYYRRIRNTFHYVFVDQGRQPLIIALAVSVSVLNASLKWWQRIGLAVLLFAMLKVFFNYWKLPDIVPLIVVPLITLFLLKRLIWDEYKDNPKNELLGIASVFIVLFLLFSSVQFDSLRYLLCVIPMYIVLTMYFVNKAIPLFKSIGVSIIALVAIVSSVYFISQDKNFGDDTLNYVGVSQTIKESVEFLEDGNYYQEKIQVPFIYFHALRRVECSYLSNNKTFDNAFSYSSTFENYQPTFRIFDNMEGEDLYEEFLNEDGMELIFEREKGNYWVKIYKIN